VIDAYSELDNDKENIKDKENFEGEYKLKDDDIVTRKR
jgi:hypothetical protein